jgi:hypothetical protein
MSSPAGDDVVVTIGSLCEVAQRLTGDGALAERARFITDRFRGPLRVAIAGRVKAGKSTLLNALVGERLAMTDAGECTRLVTVYRHADGYEVHAHLHDGTRRTLGFRRGDGALEVDLDGLSTDDIATLDVGWPSAVLRRLTLIDTPGLASLDGPTSRRTLDFFDHHERGNDGAGADAVVYLMRHLHRADGEFLASFMDRSVIGASPVNAIAVLSRADEVGAGRIDAMTSAGIIAERYAADSGVSSLVSAVVPVAGLMAETAVTLREDEVAALKAIALMPDHERATLLLSTDDFCDVALSPLTAERRRELLLRLGLYGVRCAIAEVTDRPEVSAGELARVLATRSGIAALHERIAHQFGPRAKILQARSALVALRSLCSELTEVDPAAALALRAEIDRVEASAVAFARLSALHLVMSGTATLPPVERDEVIRMLDGNGLLGGSGAVSGSDTGDGADAQRSRALEGIARWRARADDPLATTTVTMVADTMARLHEHLYVTA